MLYLRCCFLKFLTNNNKTYTIWGKTLVFLYIKTQKSCHATYHQPVMVAAKPYKARRSKNFNSSIIRNSYDRKLVVASTKI